jgi:hypothetical protein
MSPCDLFPSTEKEKKLNVVRVLLVFRPLGVVCWLIHLFVADHLCAAFAVVEVVSDANHSHGTDVVGRSSLD